MLKFSTPISACFRVHNTRGMDSKISAYSLTHLLIVGDEYSCNVGKHNLRRKKDVMSGH